MGPQLGLGRAALEFVRQRAATRPISYTFFEKQSSSVAFQLQIAEAAMMIDTAHLHAYRAADDIDRAAAAGVYPDRIVRTRIRADTGYVVEKITRAIDLCCSPMAPAALRTSARCSGSGATSPSRPATPSSCR